MPGDILLPPGPGGRAGLQRGRRHRPHRSGRRRLVRGHAGRPLRAVPRLLRGRAGAPAVAMTAHHGLRREHRDEIVAQADLDSIICNIPTSVFALFHERVSRRRNRKRRP